MDREGGLPHEVWIVYVCEVECPECGAPVGKPCKEEGHPCPGCAASACMARVYARADRTDLPTPARPAPTPFKGWWEE